MKGITLKKLLSVLAALAVTIGVLTISQGTAHAAIAANVQSEQCGDPAPTSAQTTCTMSNFATSGNLVAFQVVWGGTATLTVTDNNGASTFTTAGSATAWGPSSGNRIKQYYSQNTGSTVFSTSLTFSSTPSWWYGYITEWSNVHTSSALKASSNATGTAVNNGPNNVYSTTTTGGGDFLVVGLAASTGTMSAGTGSWLNEAIADSNGNVYARGTGVGHTNCSCIWNELNTTVTGSDWGAEAMVFNTA